MTSPSTTAMASAVPAARAALRGSRLAVAPGGDGREPDAHQLADRDDDPDGVARERDGGERIGPSVRPTQNVSVMLNSTWNSVVPTAGRARRRIAGRSGPSMMPAAARRRERRARRPVARRTARARASRPRVRLGRHAPDRQAAEADGQPPASCRRAQCSVAKDRQRDAAARGLPPELMRRCRAG